MFLVQSSRMSTKGLLRAQLQDQALIAMNQITQDLRRTTAGGISIVSGQNQAPPILFVVQPIKDLLSDGTQLWDTSVIVYQWSNVGSPLTRSIVDSTVTSVRVDAAVPTTLSTPSVDIIAQTSPTSSRVLTPGVSAFSVVQLQPVDTAQPIAVSLTVQASGATGNDTPESYSCSRTTSLRNAQ